MAFFDEALFDFLESNLTLLSGWTLRNGSAEGTDPPYTVMIKIDDAEERVVLCDDQGDQGNALIQFSSYAGSGAEPETASSAQKKVNDIKNQVQDIIGVIGTAPDDYMIEYNRTGSARVLNGGDNSLSIHGIIFESTLWWRKL